MDVKLPFRMATEWKKFVEQPSGFEISSQGGMVYRLKKVMTRRILSLFILASSDVLLIPISMSSLKMA